MKNHKVQKILAIGMMSVLCTNLLTGCNFKINASKDVDNVIENTENGDIHFETEYNGMDGELTGSIEGTEVIEESVT